jgi:hypothetical protein
MGYSITFNQAKLDKLQKKMGPDLTLPPLKTLLATASKVAFDEAHNRAPSIVAAALKRDEPTSFAARVSVNHPGARAMESGRKPAVAGGKFPPPNAFLQMAHGSQAVAFAIARAVYARGTKGRFFMKKAISATNRAMPALAQKMADAISQEWAK